MRRAIRRHEHAKNWTEFRDFIEADLQDIFAIELMELKATRIYICLDSDVKAKHRAHQVSAFTSPFFSSAHRSLIGKRYRSPGPGMFLSVKHRPFNQEHRESVIHTIVHETGHWFQINGVTSGKIHYDPFEGHKKRPDRKPDEIFHGLLKNDRGAEFDMLLHQVRAHQRDFVRAVLHSAHRLSSCGWDIYQQLLWDQTLYGAADFDGIAVSQRHLRDELNSYDGQSLVKLSGTPEPRPFTNAWKRSLESRGENFQRLFDRITAKPGSIFGTVAADVVLAGLENDNEGAK